MRGVDLASQIGSGVTFVVKAFNNMIMSATYSHRLIYKMINYISNHFERFKMNRKLHLLRSLGFAKTLLLSSLLVAALSLSACGDDECEGDSCVEDVACTSNVDCEAGTYCGPDFVCVEDPCTEDTCERGVCERGKTECISSDSCTEETVAVDCLFGEICQVGNCLDEEDYCDALGCKRGVCSFEEKKCVEATDCAGDSSLCLEGSFCNEMGQCAPDLCIANDVECTDGGTCLPSLGTCGNPKNCSSNGDCLDGNICVLDSGSLGTCTLEEAACGDGPGDGGCYGNKICKYNETTQLATCEETDTCENALDCNDGRICVGNTCEDAPACEDDAFEPNNEASEATDLLADSPDGTLVGTVCADDSDFFLVDVLALSEGLTEGALLIELQYQNRDVGLGEIELEIIDPEGTSLATETSGQSGVEGKVAGLVRLNNIVEGDYTVRLRGGDDMSDAGVRYTMSASFSTVETQEACLAATELIPGASPVSGNTSDGASSAIGSTCAGAENEAPEAIFSFELEQASAVSITVIPTDGSTELSASIRESCSLATSELGCQADVTDGLNPLSPLLDAGTYYVIVQGIDGDQGGAFQISVGIGDVQCTPADNECVDGTASICTQAGTVLEEVECPVGCDPLTNVCKRVEGDLCSEAVEKSEAFSTTVHWDDFRPDTSLSSDGCVPGDDGDTQTGGPDAVWAVTIPPNKALDATLTFPSGENGSMYILESCADPSISCEIGANRGNASEERIGYANETDSDLTVYLVADRTAEDPMTDATLDVEFLDVTCNPVEEDSRCDADGNIESCNAWGTQYDVSKTCNFGCEDDPTGDASCSDPTNDTCDEPLLLTSGVPVVADLSDYSDANEPADSCDHSTANGPEAVYMITTTEPNTLVNAVMDADFDAVIYAGQSCSNSGSENEQSCLASGDFVESVEFMAATPGDYYIFADAWSSSTSSGEFTITATLTEPSCVPGEVVGCGSGTTLETCDSQGFPTTVDCRDTCVDGACVIEKGDTCEDPLVLSAGSTVSGDTGDFYEDYNLSSSSCTGYATGGKDMVYQIETTTPGQIIDIEIAADFDASLYVSQECVASGGAPTCLAGDDLPSSQDEHLVFVAQDAGVYFVYVDASSASGTFDLTADVRTPTCTPGASLGCNADELEYCGPLGESQAYACDGTCSNGACDTPTGDVCHDPIAVTNGETISDTINASGRTNSVELNGGKNNQCIIGSSKTDGKENIYRVDLLAGELLTVELTSESTQLVSYISQTCQSAAQRCLSVDSNGEDGLLQYHAKDDESVFVIIDSTDTSSHDYQFNIDISSGSACEPGGYRCLDSTTLEVCSRDGSTVLGEYICAEGCTAGACAPVDGANTCGDAPSIGGVNAPDIGTGISVQSSFASLTNSVSVPADGCTRAEGKGNDMIYAVDLAPGDVVEGRITSPSGESPMVYILSDCADADTCVAGGKAEEGMNTEEEAYARYMAVAVETVYVVADSANTSADDRFRLDISVSPAECSVSDTSCVDSDNERYCNEGLFDERFCMYGTCQGGATGACTGVAPNTCADAQVVPNDGQVHTYKGLLQDLTDDVDLGEQIYECQGIGPSPGVDAIYAIDLNNGDFLDVNLDSPADTIIWVSSSCGASMNNSCYDGTDAAPEGASESLLYEARTTGTYYVVVDAANTNVLDGEYTVDFKVRSNECTFGATECLDSNTFRRCGADRLWNETECAFGCSNGACNDVVGDTCDDAIMVPDDNQPHVFQGMMEDYTKQTDVGDHDQTCSGVSFGTNGPEVFYAVQMNEGDVVDIVWNAPRDGQLWISSSCNDTEDLLDHCIEGTDSEPNTITYVAEATGTYYVAGDNYFGTNNDGEFTMEIHVHEPECDANVYEPVCIDASTIQTCNSMGQFDEASCDCQNDSCVTSCDSADDITADAAASGGVTFTGAWADEVNEFEEYCGASSYDTDGQDFAYIVQLEAGETVSVDVDSTGLTYPAVSFVNSCTDIVANACLIDPATGSTSNVSSSYTASDAETVYILIDNDYPSGGDDYTIDIGID